MKNKPTNSPMKRIDIGLDLVAEFRVRQQHARDEGADAHRQGRGLDGERRPDHHQQPRGRERLVRPGGGDRAQYRSQCPPAAHRQRHQNRDRASHLKPPGRRNDRQRTPGKLQGAEAEDGTPQRPQALGLQLQPDEEQQENDPELGELEGLVDVGDPGETVGADHYTRRHVAQDGSKISVPGQRHRDRRRDEEDGRVVAQRYGIPTGLRAERAAARRREVNDATCRAYHARAHTPPRRVCGLRGWHRKQ